MTMKTTLLAAAAALLLATGANAATITYDFDGGSAAGVSDFGSGVTADNAVTGGHMQLAENRAHRKLQGGKIGTLAVTINIPNGVIVDLTALDFLDGMDDPINANTTYSQWDLAISTGSASPDSGSRTRLTSEPMVTSGGNTLALSGLAGLTDTSVTFTWTVYYAINPGDPPTGGNHSNRHAFLDDIVFTGAVVPEPASLALLGLGGLMIVRRR